MRTLPTSNKIKINWLLIKEKDGAADNKINITAASPHSIVSGKLLKIDKYKTESSFLPQENENPINTAIEASIAEAKVSHQNKIYYPEINLNKLDVARYYEFAANWILPYIKARPLSIFRCINGIAGNCFFQKHLPSQSLKNIINIKIKKDDKEIDSFMVKTINGLIELIQLGALEIHIWGERCPHNGYPDQIVFDLDPGENIIWQQVIDTGLLLRDILAELNLTSFVKTTGGKGLHINVPIKPIYYWQQIHAFAKTIANTLVKLNPSLYIATAVKTERQNKIFIDYLRNSQGATSIAPYSTRAKPGALIATPLTWDELNLKIHSNHFTLINIKERLRCLKEDPWESFLTLNQQLPNNMLAY